MVEQGDFYTKEKKLNFKEIVLGHIKKILELSSHELRNTSIVTIHPDHTETKTNEDTRRSYIQAIENFGCAIKYLTNKHKEKAEHINETYIKCIRVMNAYKYEIPIMFKTRYDEVCKTSGRYDEEMEDNFVFSIKLKYAKQLFSELIDFLDSIHYFEEEESQQGENPEGKRTNTRKYSDDDEIEKDNVVDVDEQ